MYSYKKRGPLGPIVMLALIMFSYQNCSDVNFKRPQQAVQNSVEAESFSGAAIEMFDIIVNEGDPLNLVAYPASELVVSNPRFVWMRGSLGIGETASPNLNGAAATLNDQGIYTVEYYDGNEFLGMASANVSVQQVVFPPAITQQPQGATINTKGAASFSVTATGSDLKYQWMKNGNVVNGATAKSLAISNAAVGDAGDYKVVVSNSVGSVESSVAKLVVNTRTVTKKFSLGKNGCGSGYCASAIPGKCGSTSNDKAQRICQRLGYTKMVARTHANGIRGVRYCQPYKKGCFINQNATCNRRFTSVTCTRQE